MAANRVFGQRQHWTVLSSPTALIGGSDHTARDSTACSTERPRARTVSRHIVPDTEDTVNRAVLLDLRVVNICARDMQTNAAFSAVDARRPSHCMDL